VLIPKSNVAWTRPWWCKSVTHPQIEARKKPLVFVWKLDCSADVCSGANDSYWGPGSIVMWCCALDSICFSPIHRQYCCVIRPTDVQYDSKTPLWVKLPGSLCIRPGRRVLWRKASVVTKKPADMLDQGEAEYQSPTVLYIQRMDARRMRGSLLHKPDPGRSLLCVWWWTDNPANNTRIFDRRIFQ
jgi:hypothetical protein